MFQTLSPRKISGFDAEEEFVVPRFEHMTDDRFDQYKVSTSQSQRQHITAASITPKQSSDTLRTSSDKPAYRQYKVSVASGRVKRLT